MPGDIDRLIQRLDRIAQMLETIMQAPGPRETPPPAPNRYLSGRWHRRDGNGYGIFPRPGEHHADHPPGNIRPPDQR